MYSKWCLYLSRGHFLNCNRFTVRNLFIMYQSIHALYASLRERITQWKHVTTCIRFRTVSDQRILFLIRRKIQHEQRYFTAAVIGFLIWYTSYCFLALIRNIATNVASMFTRTCQLSWRHLDCRDVIKICGQLWSQEPLYMKFLASFPKIYRFQQAKPIRKLTKQVGLVCWNRKI